MKRKRDVYEVLWCDTCAVYAASGLGHCGDTRWRRVLKGVARFQFDRGNAVRKNGQWTGWRKTRP
jgi:hypothetical protein